jgi:hypothetical protein
MATGGYCRTTNLQYTGEQFDELVGLGRYNMLEAQHTIKQTILSVLDNKRKRWSV